MKLLLLLPFLLGFSVPAVAHNEANGGDAFHGDAGHTDDYNLKSESDK